MQAEKQQVIIIGAARSGTKFLRNLFDNSKECNLVPYDINYVWRYGNESLDHDLISEDHYTPDNAEFINKTINKYALKNSKNNDAHITIEKTVANTIRIPFIEKVLDKPIYIHLVRDGRDVVESSSRMWCEKTNYRYLLKKIKYFPFTNYKYAYWFGKSLLKKIIKKDAKEFVWGVKYPGIYSDVVNDSIIDVCSKQWKYSVIKAENDIKKIESDRVYTIKYEDLVADPSYLEELCDFIGVKDNQAILNEYNKKVRKDNVSKWRKMNNKDIDSMLNIIDETLYNFGYTGNSKEYHK